MPETATKPAGNGGIMRLEPAAITHSRDPKRLVHMAERQSDFTNRNPECRPIVSQLAMLIAATIQNDQTEIASLIDQTIARRYVADLESTGYVIHTFEAAVWAFAPRDGFKSIVLRAVSLGNDADTVGAVAGQLAGAAYGLNAIPKPWVNVLTWRDDIVEMASKLFRLTKTP